MKTIYLVLFQSKRGLHQVVSVHSSMEKATERLKVVALEYAKENDLEKYLNFIPGDSPVANIVSPYFPRDTYWWSISKMELDQ